MRRALLSLVALATVAFLAAGCGSDAWTRLRAEVVLRNLLRDPWGREELARHRETRRWMSLNSPPPAADRSTAADANDDIEQVRSHYAPRPLDDPTTLTLLSNTADGHFVARRYNRAAALYLKVLEVRPPSGTPDAGSTDFHRLGELFLWIGKPDRAEPLFRRAVQLREQVYGKGPFLVASSLLQPRGRDDGRWKCRCGD